MTDKKTSLLHASLNESEEKYRSMFENATLGIFRSTPEGRYLEINHAFAGILGYQSPEEMVAEISDIKRQLYVNPEDRAGITGLLDRGESVKGFEAEFYHRDGHHVWICINARAVFADSGNVLYYEGTVEDITGRKQTEDALRRSEYRYRQLIELSPDPIVVHKGGLLLYANPATKKLFNSIDQDDFLGRNIIEFIHPDYHALVIDRMHRIEETGTLPIDEMKCITLNGDIIDVTVTAAKIDFEGQTATMNILRDITALKKTEDLLRQSEKMHRTLINVSPDLIVIFDLDYKFLFVSDQAVEMFGLDSKEEVVGDSVLNWIIPNGIEKVMRNTPLLINRTVPIPNEYTGRKKDGKTFPIEVKGKALMDESGKPESIMAAVRDITERKSIEEENRRLQEQLYQTQKLESIGVLAGGIAHDFNNMLSVIVGNAELALMDISEMSPVTPRLRNINKVALNAANLCKQLLTYSGKGQFVMTLLNMSEVINEMRPMLEASVSKKVMLDFRIPDDIPNIKADLAQIQQVLMNLVINGSEAIGENPGTLTVTAKSMLCDKAYLSTANFADQISPGTYVCLEVTDTGCGMDSKTLNKIFDPFFTTKFTGRGLGLASVLGIVRNHKGAVKIYSEPGHGTTFKIFLPEVETSGADAKESEIMADDWKGNGTILLVDDDIQVIQACREMLEKVGFEVLTASDGTEAVMLYSRHTGRIQCIILDLTMPGTDGRETCSQIQAIDPNAKIIISSGFNESEVMRYFNGRNIAGFIQKPYLLKQLRQVLGSVLADNQIRTENEK